MVRRTVLGLGRQTQAAEGCFAVVDVQSSEALGTMKTLAGRWGSEKREPGVNSEDSCA